MEQKFSDIILVLKLFVSKPREYEYHNKPDIISVILERNRRAHRPALFYPAPVPPESMYIHPATLHINLFTCKKSGMCYFN